LTAGRLLPVATIRDFPGIATCYSHPKAGFGQ
jgi:hypothetical protein